MGHIRTDGMRWRSGGARRGSLIAALRQRGRTCRSESGFPARTWRKELITALVIANDVHHWFEHQCVQRARRTPCSVRFAQPTSRSPQSAGGTLQCAYCVGADRRKCREIYVTTAASWSIRWSGRPSRYILFSCDNSGLTGVRQAHPAWVTKCALRRRGPSASTARTLYSARDENGD